VSGRCRVGVALALALALASASGVGVGVGRRRATQQDRVEIVALRLGDPPVSVGWRRADPSVLTPTPAPKSATSSGLRSLVEVASPFDRGRTGSDPGHAVALSKKTFRAPGIETVAEEIVGAESS